MKQRKYSSARYGIAGSAYVATSIAVMLGALSINVATAQSNTAEIDISACQTLSDSTALDSDSIKTRMACYSRDVEHLNQLVNQLMEERAQLTSQTKQSDKLSIEAYEQELANRQSAMQRLEERAAALTQQIDEITNDRNQIRKQLYGVLSEGQSRSVEVEANEKLFESFSTSYVTLSAEIVELQNKLKEFENKNSELTNQNNAQAELAEQLKTKITTLEQTVANLNADKNQLEADVSAAQTKLASMKSQMLDNAAIAQDRIAEIAELKKSISSSEQSRLELQAQIKSLNENHLAALSALHDQSTVLNDKILELEIREQSLTSQAKSASNEMQSTIDARDTEIAELSRSRKELNAQREQLIAKVTSLEASNLEQTLGFKTQATILETQITELTSNKFAISKELQNQKTANDKLQAEAKKSNDKNSELNLLADNLRNQLKEASSAGQTLQANIETLEQQSDAKTREYSEKLSELNTTIEQSQTARDALAGELDTVRPKLKTAEEGLRASNQKNEALTSEVETLEKQLAKAAQEQKILSASLDETQAKSNQTSEKLASLKNDSATLKTLLDLSRAHSENADATLTELRAQIDAKDARLLEKQNELQALLSEKQRIENNSKAMAGKSKSQAELIGKTLLEAGHSNVKVAVGEDNNIGVLLGSGQLFRTGSARLSADGKKVLTDLAGTFEAITDRRIMISGHSDNVPLGEKLSAIFKDNWGLSMARALATANFFTEEANIAAERMTVSGFGATKPIASNDTPEGRQQNRRVEILLAPIDEQIASAK